MSNKRLIINMLASLVGFAVSMGISFILTPYITETVGKEAYGFVGLANNFVSYGQLVTLALNSMAGRFITIKIHQGDTEGANKYFTSVVVVNTLTAVALMIPAVLIIINLNNIINVPYDILQDVQILWSLVFANFLIGLVLTTFNVATFVTNRLDLSSIRDIQSNLLRVLILVGAFSILTPNVWYIGLASIICTIFVGFYNVYYKYKLLPNIKIQLKYFDIKVILELLASGIWHVVIKLGQILSDGLDLLMSNIFIDPMAMGTLAIAKTVPNAINMLLGTVTGVFSPQLTIHYAKDNKIELISELTKSMKFTGVFTNIPLSFLFVFGVQFYTLWVPNENIRLIHTAACLTILSILVIGVVNPLFNVFTITNKVKIHSAVIVLHGFLNITIVYLLLNSTNLGILAIAGVSSVTAILLNMIYTPVYAAHCLGCKSSVFYPVIFKYILSSIVLIGLFTVFSSIFLADTWFKLIFTAFICGITGLGVNSFILLDKSERNYLISLLLKRMSKQ